MSENRNRDLMVAEKVMGLEIVHRSWPCGRDPECGEYEAALDDDPEMNGSWFNKRDAIYKTSQPLDEWKKSFGLWCKPVPFYSANIDDAWDVWLKARELRPHQLAMFWSALRSHVQIRMDNKNLISDAAAALYMEPADICNAMLEAHDIRTLPDWYYE